jgi:hypothetical protein
LVSFYIESPGKRHSKPGGDEDSDPHDVLATGPAQLPVCVDDEAVQHQPSAQRHKEAGQRAAPPANETDGYCHDRELGTPVDALACAGDRHRYAESHAERHDANECVRQSRIRDAEGPAANMESTGPAVRQRQHGCLLFESVPNLAADSVKLCARRTARFLMEP